MNAETKKCLLTLEIRFLEKELQSIQGNKERLKRELKSLQDREDCLSREVKLANSKLIEYKMRLNKQACKTQWHPSTHSSKVEEREADSTSDTFGTPCPSISEEEEEETVVDKHSEKPPLASPKQTTPLKPGDRVQIMIQGPYYKRCGEITRPRGKRGLFWYILLDKMPNEHTALEIYKAPSSLCMLCA